MVKRFIFRLLAIIFSYTSYMHSNFYIWILLDFLFVSRLKRVMCILQKYFWNYTFKREKNWKTSMFFINLNIKAEILLQHLKWKSISQHLKRRWSLDMYFKEKRVYSFSKQIDFVFKTLVQRLIVSFEINYFTKNCNPRSKMWYTFGVYGIHLQWYY